MFEREVKAWKILSMTVVADDRRRVTIRLAKPGERFRVQVAGEGKYVLTRLESAHKSRRAKVRVEKRGLFSVGVLDRPIDEKAMMAALREFP